MKAQISFGRSIQGHKVLSVVLSVLCSVLLVSGFVYATSIGTSISVDGTLSVTGLTTLGNATTTILSTTGNFIVNGYATTTAASGNFATAGTLNVTGLTTLGNASTTLLSATGNFMVNGFATTTAANGNFATAGTLNVTGLSTLGNASTTLLSATGNFMVNGFATTTAANGNFATAGTLNVTGLSTLGNASTTRVTSEYASTTRLVVGGNGTNFAGMVGGYCNIPATTVNASTSGYAVCSSATGILADDRVFVMATSSLPENFTIRAASSTAADTISVQIFNEGNIAGTDTGVRSFNFWAFR